MFTLTLGQHSYHLIRHELHNDYWCFYWLWGKIDFESHYVKKDNQWILKGIFMVQDGRQYQFVQISHIGTLFEEIEWKSADKKIYIELPIHFSKDMHRVSQQFFDHANQ